MPGLLYQTMVACDHDSRSPACESAPAAWREVARATLSVLNQVYPTCPMRVDVLVDPVETALRAVEVAEQAAQEQHINPFDAHYLAIPVDVGKFTAERYAAVKHATDHGCPTGATRPAKAPPSAAPGAPLPPALNGKRTSRDTAVGLMLAAAALLFISRIPGGAT